MKFILTSEKQEGTTLLDYNSQGFLILLDTAWTFADLPAYDRFISTVFIKANLDKLIAKSPERFKLTEAPDSIDTSFDSFWNTYKYKVGDKKKCIKLWEALPTEQRILCLRYIPKYLARIQSKNQDQKYPQGFLNMQEWNNE